jgi:hypothetical protein
MVIKWESPKIESFDDVPRMINRRHNIFKSVVPSFNKKPFTCGLALNFKPHEYSSTHDFCIRLINAANWPMALPYEQIAQFIVHCGYEYQKHGVKTYIGTEYTFNEGKAYFENNRAFLTHKYNGEYIAIWDDKVFDHDTRFSALAERVYKELGYSSIYMPFVTLKKRVLRFESPIRGRSVVNVPRH